MKASRGARRWIRTLRAISYIFVVIVLILLGHAFIQLVTEGPAAEQRE